MVRQFHRFLASQSGAVTVDWVVLTALSAGFALMVLLTLGSGTTDVGTQVQNHIGAVQVSDVQRLGFSE